MLFHLYLHSATQNEHGMVTLYIAYTKTNYPFSAKELFSRLLVDFSYSA